MTKERPRSVERRKCARQRTRILRDWAQDVRTEEELEVLSTLPVEEEDWWVLSFPVKRKRGCQSRNKDLKKNRRHTPSVLDKGPHEVSENVVTCVFREMYRQPSYLPTEERPETLEFSTHGTTLLES